MPDMLVRDWMSPNVIAVSPTTSIYEAHRILCERDIRRLPVVEEGRLLGIVTRGDIRGAQPSEATTLSIWEVNYLLGKTTVADIMHRSPITISPKATLREAAKLMMESKISGLPVVDANGVLAGIITESDIFRMIVQNWDAVAANQYAVISNQ